MISARISWLDACFSMKKNTSPLHPISNWCGLVVKPSLDIMVTAKTPNDPSAFWLPAECRAATGRYTKAEPLLRTAISLLGSSSPPKYDAIRAHYMLGRLLQRTARSDEATKELVFSEQLRKQLRD